MATKNQLQDQIKELQASLDHCKETEASILVNAYMKGEMYPAFMLRELETRVRSTERRSFPSAPPTKTKSL